MFNSYAPKTSNKTTNYNGGPAVKARPESELAYSLLSGFLAADSFYEKNNDKIKRIKDLVSKVDATFALKLAIVARNEFNLRTPPIFLLALLTLRGVEIPTSVISRIFLRGDEVAEYIAAVKALSNKGVLTKASHRVANQVLNGLTERQALRYMGGGKSWKLADVIKVTHPVAHTSKQSALFKFLVNQAGSTNSAAWDTLDATEKNFLPAIANSFENKSAVSWESARSEGASWNSVVKDMGYMALLRNLRNFLQDDDFTQIDYVAGIIGNADEVRKSKQLPFRFFSAYRELMNIPGLKANKIMRAISAALDSSVENYEVLQGKTLYIVDGSGSMSWGNVSNYSKLTYANVANVLGAIGALKDGADVVAFGSSAKKIPVTGSAFDIMKAIETSFVGGGTDLMRVRDIVPDLNKYKNIVLLSDMQITGSARAVFSKFEGRIYSVNLAGYEGSIEIDNATNLVSISGWSDSVFKLMNAESKGIVEHIKATSI